MALPAPDVFDSLVPIAFVPVPVEVLGRNGSELDDEVARQVLRFDLAALFPPKAQEGAPRRSPMMIRASDPPMKERRLVGFPALAESFNVARLLSSSNVCIESFLSQCIGTLSQHRRKLGVVSIYICTLYK